MGNIIITGRKVFDQLLAKKYKSKPQELDAWKIDQPKQGIMTSNGSKIYGNMGDYIYKDMNGEFKIMDAYEFESMFEVIPGEYKKDSNSVISFVPEVQPEVVNEEALKEVEEGNLTGKELDELNLVELKKLAADEGIDITKCKVKAQILEAIKEYYVSTSEPIDNPEEEVPSSYATTETLPSDTLNTPED